MTMETKKPNDEVNTNNKTTPSDRASNTIAYDNLPTNKTTIHLLPEPTPSSYAYALSSWTSLFSHIAPSTLHHPDLATFQKTHTAPNGRLLIATAPAPAETPTASDGKNDPSTSASSSTTTTTTTTPPEIIVGTIAYRAYDNRFSHLHPALSFPPATKAVEVSRLFVSPSHRGRGLARRLIEALVEVAREDGVRVLYLHTHPFLPGARDVWERMGWGVVVREEVGPWWTVHLRRDV